jgi:hypothetical protein
MPNPWLSLPHPWIAVSAAAALTVLVIWLMAPSRALLQNGVATKHIASLELAPNAARADAVIKSWGAAGVEAAKQNIALDCLFIPAYTTLLALLWFAAASALRSRLPGVASFVTVWGWAMWGAGLLDYIEDFCDYRMLEHGATDVLARVSSICATVKFVVTLVFVKILF